MTPADCVAAVDAAFWGASMIGVCIGVVVTWGYFWSRGDA